jgi:hypothetical protein
MGPYDCPEQALRDIEVFRKDPRKLMLAVIDKQREQHAMDCFAGVYGLIEYNAEGRASQVQRLRSAEIKANTSCALTPRT